ncbi:hypothetical protein B0H13DRAFT_2328369 [Mycena leptocephala]|nr:hypothetical protein B0H13DRAFT_2328369 [Mycena leptocephala]
MFPLSSPMDSFYDLPVSRFPMVAPSPRRWPLRRCPRLRLLTLGLFTAVVTTLVLVGWPADQVPGNVAVVKGLVAVDDGNSLGSTQSMESTHWLGEARASGTAKVPTQTVLN